MQKPQPPKAMNMPYQAQRSESILEVVFQDISALRSKIEQFSQVGICGKNELAEFEADLYAIQTKLYEASFRR